MLAPLPGNSHWLMIQHIISELVTRGHQVTSINALKFNGNMENYTEILLDPPYLITEDGKRNKGDIGIEEVIIIFIKL